LSKPDAVASSALKHEYALRLVFGSTDFDSGFCQRLQTTSVPRYIPPIAAGRKAGSSDRVGTGTPKPVSGPGLENVLDR
jgi:hypothetical protein